MGVFAVVLQQEKFYAIIALLGAVSQLPFLVYNGLFVTFVTIFEDLQL